jgi:hypothetical protein
MCRKPFLLGVLALLLCAGPAQGQNANGLYEPFPERASNERAQRFIEHFAGREPALRGVTSRDLRNGLWLTTPRAPARPPSPSSRADGSAADTPSLGWILDIALLLAVASIPVALVAGRRARSRRVAIVVAGSLALALTAVALAQPDAERAPAGAGIAPAPKDFFGTVSEDAYAGSGAYRRAAVARQASAGVGIVRQRVDWAELERRPGRYDLARLDSLVADLARRRLELLPVLIGSPPFRSTRPATGGRDDAFYPPRDPAALGRFAAILARRYGPGGSLWRERPQLPAVPVRSWQVWNEPNLPIYWPSGPDPAAYVRLLRGTGAALRRIDPGAEIVAAGLPQSRLGIPFERYLRGMYRAGARGAFDTLAIHPFSRDELAALAAVEQARTLMDRNHDNARIWITELGWASGGPRSPFTVGESRQAELITRALRALAARRESLRLRGVVYFNWRDLPIAPGGEDFFGLHSGLIDRRGRAKPALRAFERAVAAAR